MSQYRIPSVALAGTLIAGPALALPPATAALAAMFETPLPMRELILLGSLLLLSLALALRISRRRHRVHRNPDGPDLRWWKNP